MTKRQLTSFRKRLEAEHAASLAWNGQPREITLEHPADQLDEALERSLADVAALSFGESLRKLRSIERALSSIASGEYGRCDECGEEISAKRLATIPWVATCIRCQETIEQEALSEVA